MRSTNLPISAIWAGRVIGGLVVAFMTLDGVMKLIKPAPVVQATTKLGIADHLITPIGLVLLVSTLLYALRSTAVLGAVLLTGFLGGACATNLRAGTPLFNILFPIGLGVLAWAGLIAREPELLRLFFRKPTASALSARIDRAPIALE